jgi:hypothetical protein
MTKLPVLKKINYGMEVAMTTVPVLEIINYGIFGTWY